MIGRVYKIVNADESIVYVGSTINDLDVRWSQHISGAKSCKEGKYRNLAIYDSFTVHGIDKFHIEMIKEYDVIDTKHLRAWEQLWMNKLNCVNTQSCFMPISKRMRDRIYVAANREQMNIKKKERYFANHAENLVKRKEYRAANRDRVNEKKKEKIMCECGIQYNRPHKARHMNTAKHQARLQQV